MFDLTLVGIGTGNPDHLTRQAIKALNTAGIILIPRKGALKSDLADLRLAICAEVVTNPATRIVEFDLPVRDASNPDYLSRVDDWHDAIALCWADATAGSPDPVQNVALLVWGDPSLYDSTLRIAARLNPTPKVTVIPGITSIQALCAAHTIPMNDIGAPVLVTTGRQLRDKGWPDGAETLVIMLDGDCAFQTLDPTSVAIWWAGYVGMREEILFSGPLTTTGPQIIAARATARVQHGWIMDIYLLRRNRS